MKHRGRGFTLIELMIAVAVIGILASVSYPSYVEYVKRGHRSQGQQFLLDVAERQEHYFMTARQYSNSLTLLGLTTPVDVAKHYKAADITVDNDVSPPTFLVKLEPATSSSLADDGILFANSSMQHWREAGTDTSYNSGIDYPF